MCVCVCVFVRARVRVFVCVCAVSYTNLTLPTILLFYNKSLQGAALALDRAVITYTYSRLSTLVERDD